MSVKSSRPAPKVKGPVVAGNTAVWDDASNTLKDGGAPPAGGSVTTTGSPGSGNLAKFSSATSITNADLTGDVTTAGGVGTTIANAVVTLAKIANAAANSKLVGSGTAGAGAAYSEISLGSGLAMTGTTLSATGTGGTVTNTGTLTANQLIIGNGGVDEKVLGTLGTTTTVLHGNAAGAPTFGAVDLTADVTGTLPATKGGTDNASYAVGDVLYALTTTSLGKLADVSAGSYLRSGGVSTAPVWSTLKIPNASTQGDTLYADAANSIVVLAKDTNATRYLSNTGTSNNPAWAQVNLANGVTGNIPVANLGNGTYTRTTNSSTGAQNDLSVSIAGNTCCEWSGASDMTVTGISGGTSGINLIVKNTGSKVAYFSYASGSSSSANRFQNLVTSSTTAIAPGGWISYIHNGTNWLMVGHEQGSYITPTYSGGNFTLSGDRTWTVDSGDVLTYVWKVTGQSLHVIWKLATTTISGGATSGFFKIAIPNSYSPTVGVLSMSAYFLVGATEYVAYGTVAAAATTIGCAPVPNVADLGTGTNNIYNYGQIWFQIS